MTNFNPQKLHVNINKDLNQKESPFERCYTLTHSDVTGDLFLEIGPDYNKKAINNFYTKLMRDEVLGEWQTNPKISLNLHCHVSGGFVIGPAKWRNSIFRQHLPMVLEAICYGDQDFLKQMEGLTRAPVLVHFHAKQPSLDCVENWGEIQDHL